MSQVSSTCKFTYTGDLGHGQGPEKNFFYEQNLFWKLHNEAENLTVLQTKR